MPLSFFASSRRSASVQRLPALTIINAPQRTPHPNPQFLTNVFYIPYLALRAAPEPLPDQQQQQQGARALPPPPPPNNPLPGWAPAFGGTAVAVGLFSLGWAAVARPEYGDLADRVSYAVQQFNTNRVSGICGGFGREVFNARHP